MNWKRATARTISEISALRYGSRFRHGFRILLYHSIGARLAHDKYGISIAPKLFEKQMEFLTSNEQVSIDSFCSQQFSNLKLRVAVTIDDGYKDSLHVAAPILLRYKIPFTVFVISSFIRNRSQEHLTPSELRELSELPGVTIGSHGATHQPLAVCDDLTLRRELCESRAYLEDVTGRQVSAVSYPYGSVNLRVRDAAENAGYDRGGCSRFGINSQRRDPLLLCRCEILSSDSERWFLQKLSGASDWYRWRTHNLAF